jgi:hypothetical protein
LKIRSSEVFLAHLIPLFLFIPVLFFLVSPFISLANPTGNCHVYDQAKFQAMHLQEDPIELERSVYQELQSSVKVEGNY